MGGSKAVVVLIALSSLLGMVFLLAAQEPTLASCCSSSCYAKSKRPDLEDVCTRDPKYWDDDARRHGYTISKAPEEGAIVVFEAGEQGADWGRQCKEDGGPDSCSGHVAYVEEVRSPVEYLISEKGWSPRDESCEARSRVAYTGQGVSFIYRTPQVSDSLEETENEPSADAEANGTAVVQGNLEGTDNQRWQLLPDGDYFKIVHGQSGKCLEVSGGSHDNGTKVVQWDCYGGDNQRWRLVPVGEDFRIVAKHSGKCLDVTRSSQRDGAPIVQWDCNGSDNQLWKRVPRGGDVEIVAKHSGRRMELSVSGDEPVDHEGEETEDQSWRLVPEGKYYRIVAEHSKKCLDVSGVLPSDGAAVMQWDCNGGDNQLWEFVREGDAYRVVAKHSGKCLDVSEASQADGAAIIQWECNGGENQLWKPVGKDGSDSFKMVAQHSGKCLSVAGESDANGAAIIQWADPREADGL